jgi:hypothetical protein
VVARAKTGCALELDYGNLRVLLPGGEAPVQDVVPAGEIVLGAKDAQAWKDQGFRTVNPPPGGWVELRSDGERLWLEEGQ